MRSPNISSKTIFEYFWNFFIFDQKKVKLKIKKILFFSKIQKKWRQSIFSLETHSRDGFRKSLMTKADKLLNLRKGQKPFLAPYQSWRNRVKWYWKRNHRKLAITNCQSSIHLGPHAKNQRKIQRKYLRTDQFLLNFGIIFCTTVVLNIVKSKSRKNYNFCSFLTI